MKREEVRGIAEQFLERLRPSVGDAVALLKPFISQRLHFPLFDYAGEIIGEGLRARPARFFTLLDKIEATKAMGGYVVIGSSLVQLIESDLDEVMQQSRKHIINGDVWYVTDIIGERVWGRALELRFNEVLKILSRFLKDEHHWVRRGVGVAVHRFTKWNRTEQNKVVKLLKLLEPALEEKRMAIVKGIGWGLKTIGHYYPDLLVAFLLKNRGRKLSGTMKRKAVTYLSERDKRKLRISGLGNPSHRRAEKGVGETSQSRLSRCGGTFLQYR
jgi:3-methyladenine DNA glycosylase AlkD